MLCLKYREKKVKSYCVTKISQSGFVESHCVDI
ncbi:hypothetical protein M2138_001918 [Dysgonomonadaceae bacterium PH5-43]|nr:hypothetical protein [Dysgonomonadaceae bacterium PH5-43]